MLTRIFFFSFHYTLHSRKNNGAFE